MISYIVHSSFSIIFPLHLLYFLVTTKHTASSLLKGLALAISIHLAPGQKYAAFRFPVARFLRLALALTVGITIPALLWFAAVSLSSCVFPALSLTSLTTFDDQNDRCNWWEIYLGVPIHSKYHSNLVTFWYEAIWNTNAFFAYAISVKVLNLRWDAKHLLAVVFATLGTFAVVYGGASVTDQHANGKPLWTASSYKPSAPLIGNLLTLLASFGYGLYTVFYKVYAALPSDPRVADQEQYEVILGEEEGVIPDPEVIDTTDAVYPPPFGFHPNLITSLLGFFTFIFLWIPLPFLHWSGIEHFRLPPDWWTTLAIAGIALSGVAFNGGFMVIIITALFWTSPFSWNLFGISGVAWDLGSSHSVCWQSANDCPRSYSRR